MSEDARVALPTQCAQHQTPLLRTTGLLHRLLSHAAHTLLIIFLARQDSSIGILSAMATWVNDATTSLTYSLIFRRVQDWLCFLIRRD